jgi:hypothetical protein
MKVRMTGFEGAMVRRTPSICARVSACRSLIPKAGLVSSERLQNVGAMVA